MLSKFVFPNFNSVLVDVPFLQKKLSEKMYLYPKRYEGYDLLFNFPRIRCFCSEFKRKGPKKNAVVMIIQNLFSQGVNPNITPGFAAKVNGEIGTNSIPSCPSNGVSESDPRPILSSVYRVCGKFFLGLWLFRLFILCLQADQSS